MHKRGRGREAVTTELKAGIRTTILATVESKRQMDRRTAAYGLPAMRAIARAHKAVDEVTLPEYLVGHPRGEAAALAVTAARREFLASSERLLKALAVVYPVDLEKLRTGARPSTGLAYL